MLSVLAMLILGTGSAPMAGGDSPGQYMQNRPSRSACCLPLEGQLYVQTLGLLLCSSGRPAVFLELYLNLDYRSQEKKILNELYLLGNSIGVQVRHICKTEPIFT